MTFRITRDRTFAMKLRATATEGEDLGDLALATCSAVLKKAINGKPPASAVEPAATFSVAFDADLPGWVLSLAPSITDDLEPGVYVTDSRVVLASGHVPPTGYVQITVGQEVTGP